MTIEISENTISVIQQELVDLQIRFAYQERLVQDLDSVIQEQQKQIEKLIEYQKNLELKLDKVSNTEVFNLQEEKPPHY